MEKNYADVLESYLIAEEGFGNFLKGMKNKILKFIKWLIDKCKELGQKITSKLRKPKQKASEVKADNVEPKLMSIEEARKRFREMGIYKSIKEGLTIFRKDYLSHVLENIKSERTDEETPSRGIDHLQDAFDNIRSFNVKNIVGVCLELPERIDIMEGINEVTKTTTSLLEQLQQMVERTPETDENKEHLRVINSHVTQVSKIMTVINTLESFL